jgi:hypothetical protein
LQWFEETGLIGAVPMFAATGWALFLIVRGAVRRHSNRSKLILRGLFAASVVVLVHGWSDFALQVPAIAALWTLLLGCGAGIALSGHETPAKALPQQDSARSAGVRPRLRGPLAICAGIAVVSVAAGSLLFAELTVPAMPTLVPLGTVYASRATTAISGKNTAAVGLTNQELAQNPASAAGWLRLAHAEALRTGKVGEGVSGLIERSFLVGPLDPDVFEWRSRYALENWDRVSAAVRDDVLASVRASWIVWPQKVWLEKTPSSLANPAGRLALSLAIADLKARDAAVRRSEVFEQTP